ncbi:uncharacterized protein LOC126820429 [Patella vulgata]|uniref:uncharacterized protein LOC126820429 n=1 Tax=Patella vulgata TaxID=6465 RepID=UPI00217F2452|nr:uncharacterized protein LOC126820429 [Patella vulgata]
MSSNKEAVRLVMLGKTGSGKSSLANALLGKKYRFKCGTLLGSVTTTSEADEGYCKGTAVKVVDTPGFFDTNVEEEENKREIIRCLALSEAGPNRFVFCINAGARFTKEDSETFRNVKMIFGDSVTEHMEIVFTNRGRLDEDGISEKEYIESAPSELNKMLREVRNKPVFINSKSPNLETELGRMSILIKGVKTDSFYTHVKYNRAIGILKRLVEVEGKYMKAYTQWKNKREDIVNCFSNFEFDLNNMVKDVRISKIAGGVGGIVGSTMAVVGVVAAPLTLGTSLILTATGAAIGIAGGVTGGGATIADVVITKKRKKEMEALLKEDRELLVKLGDEEVKFYHVLSEVFSNNEIKCVIQNVVNKSITRSNDKVFKEEVKKGLDKAGDYLLQLLNVENKYLEPVETDTKHDASVVAANAAVTTGGQVAKTVAVATDATTDVVGSVARSAATAVKVTAIAGIVASIITLPLDLYTIIQSSKDLHLNTKHQLATIIHNIRENLKENMDDYDKDRDVLFVFVDGVSEFLYPLQQRL